MAAITLRVNGKAHTVDVEPSTPLLYVLRNDLDLSGPRFGCGLGQCGACMVLIKGEAVRSCIRPVSTIAGAEITTLEGLARNGTLHPVQQAWIDEQVPQCGFCQNGQILVSPIQRVANRHLYYGVTHIMSLGLDGPEMDAFQAEQRAGRTTGAHVSFAGYGFSATSGWTPKQLQGGDLHRPTMTEDARAMVRQEIARTVDVIKIWEDDSHGELPKFSPEYGAIIDEAHKNGRKVFTHMFMLEDAKELMRRGLDVLAHSVRDKEVDDEYLRLAKEKHVTQITGLVGHGAEFVYTERPAFLDDPGLSRLYAK
jgi:aerobic-type carbon monoxide dehydrogenase small subunit (CoxS/CutS family)